MVSRNSGVPTSDISKRNKMDKMDPELPFQKEEETDFSLVERNVMLRNYQMYLLEKAKKQNSILFLPTGSGKTLIAIHVLVSRSSGILRPFNEGGKRAFFLLPTKVMVYQTAKFLRIHTKFKVMSITGDMSVDSWSRNTWRNLFEENHVFVLTGEILKIILNLNFISPSEISLLVLDECHHAVREHPYKLVLEMVNAGDPNNAPLILGLSSVLLKTTPNENEVEKALNQLQISMNSKVITESHMEEVLSFSSNPEEKLVTFELESPSRASLGVSALYDCLIDTLDIVVIDPPSDSNIPNQGFEFKTKNRSRRIKKAVVQSKLLFEELGMFGGSLGALFFIIEFEKFRLMSTNPVEVQVLIYVRTEFLKLRRAYMRCMGEEESRECIFRFSSPKVQQLLRILKEVHEANDGKEIRTIIFVKERMKAMILSFLLNRLSFAAQDYNFLKADFAVGISNVGSDLLFLKNKSEEVVMRFAAGSINTLIATSLLEEGIDVPSCNVVISFDFPGGYSSYFQTRGRARNKESIYFMFSEESEAASKMASLKLFKAVNEKLFKLVTKNADDDEGGEGDIACGNDDDDEDDEIPNETIPSLSGQSITADGIMAIKAVYRYCYKLPQDKYSSLAPVCWYTNVRGKKKGFVQLPMNCPLIDVIEGHEKSTKKEAKRSVFLATIRKLHEMGELDEDLNPTCCKLKEEEYSYLLPHFKDEEVEGEAPLPGTRRKKRTYPVKFAECLTGCMPEPEVKAYLHVIKFAITFEKPALERKADIYEVLKMPATFALLSSKKLVKIMKFPIFLDMGEIDCELLVNYDEMVLTQSEITDIKECHFTLFKKVTRVMKNSQIFDTRNKEHSFFIVPVKKNLEDRYVLNWELIRCDYCKNNSSALVKPSYLTSINKYKRAMRNYGKDERAESSTALVPLEAIQGQMLWEINRAAGQDKPTFEMTEGDYKYFIIYPNYRNEDFPQRYVVGKFCTELSPLSPFPKTQFEDYIAYYKTTYAAEITNAKQPLLRVSPIFNCSNFNKPRKGKMARDKSKNYQEHLVPELCNVIPFDRDFYLKALLLPTVLNRIYHVYCVEEFRRQMFTEMGLYDRPEEGEWDSLCPEKDNEDEGECCYREPPELPLMKLKVKTQSSKKSILDPESHIYEVGLCDLEFSVGALKNFDWEKEIGNGKQMEDNIELVKLLSLRETPLPNLNTLKVSRGPSARDLVYFVQACTAKAANDSINYDRLEILGDSLLKFATTLFLFRNFSLNEAVLAELKDKIVRNRNLFYCGLAKNFQDIINVTDFAPLSDWNPPLVCLPERLVKAIVEQKIDPAVIYRFDIPSEEQFSGNLSEQTFEKNEEIIRGYEKCFEFSTSTLLSYRLISDKTIADCLEAFIGVFLQTLGLRHTFDFLLWLKVLPTPEGSYQELIETPLKTYPKDQDQILYFLEQISYTELEKTLNYKFKNKALLLEALTHPSYAKNRITNCYQRLEFFGDAVLDFLMTSYIYEYCGNLTPGEVTDIRSSLVNNITFACLTVRYELYKYMLSFSSTLMLAINSFVSFQVERNHVLDDNVLVLMEEENYSMAEAMTVPKALGDIFESLAAAIYFDSGNSLKTVWRVYYPMIKRELDEFTRTVPKTPMRLLCEISGDKPFFESKVLSNGMVMIACTIYYENEELKAFGFGRNNKDAKRSACKVILNRIVQMKK